MELMGLEKFQLFDKENEEKVLRNWTTPLEPFDDLTWLTAPNDSEVWKPLEPVEYNLSNENRECLTEMSDSVLKKIYEDTFLMILEGED